MFTERDPLGLETLAGQVDAVYDSVLSMPNGHTCLVYLCLDASKEPLHSIGLHDDAHRHGRGEFLSICIGRSVRMHTHIRSHRPL